MYLPDARRLFVANGAGGGVEAFADGKASAVARSTDLDDADNLRFDPVSGHLYVGYAHAMAVLDLRTHRRPHGVVRTSAIDALRRGASGGWVVVAKCGPTRSSRFEQPA